MSEKSNEFLQSFSTGNKKKKYVGKLLIFPECMVHISLRLKPYSEQTYIVNKYMCTLNNA